MAKLVGICGEHKGKVYALDECDAFRIGRSKQECELRIASSAVSRLHAMILRDRNQFYVVDDGSHNGTRLNDVRIDGQGRQRLCHGAKIQVCGNIFEFHHDESQLIEPEMSSSIIEVTLSHREDSLDSQPATTLAWLLKLAGELSRTRDLSAALTEVMNRVAALFEKADRVLLFLREGHPTQGQLYLADSRVKTSDHVGYSKTLIQECLNKGNGIVAKTARELSGGAEESCVASGIQSVMCAPLQGRKGTRFGVLQLDTQSPTRKFSEADLHVLMAVALHVSVVMEQAEDQQGLLQYEKVKRDLEVARNIQRGLLPKNELLCPNYDIVGFYEPAREVGGDYYDWIPLGDGRYAVIQGDVAGKGIAAALFMARMSAVASYAIQTEETLSLAFNRLNRHACEMSNFDRFVTMAAAILDPVANKVTLVNAGHNIPLRYSESSGKVEEVMILDDVGLPLGLDESTHYVECEIDLTRNYSLLLFTDGVTDCRSVDGSLFGTEGIRQSVSQAGLRAQQILDRLVQSLERHQRGREAFDDTTITCIGRKA